MYINVQHKAGSVIAAAAPSADLPSPAFHLPGICPSHAVIVGLSADRFDLTQPHLEQMAAEREQWASKRRRGEPVEYNRTQVSGERPPADKVTDTNKGGREYIKVEDTDDQTSVDNTLLDTIAPISAQTRRHSISSFTSSDSTSSGLKKHHKTNNVVKDAGDPRADPVVQRLLKGRARERSVEGHGDRAVLPESVFEEGLAGGEGEAVTASLGSDRDVHVSFAPLTPSKIHLVFAAGSLALVRRRDPARGPDAAEGDVVVPLVERDLLAAVQLGQGNAMSFSMASRSRHAQARDGAGADG
ncbi:hypothetical protein K438DRAFT_2087026 [Mycena galopus ATCC 62051]|nr:hypothetical protein K438DRAFT_2087026 [Mycena galopus ATCC 62051]